MPSRSAPSTIVRPEVDVVMSRSVGCLDGRVRSLLATLKTIDAAEEPERRATQSLIGVDGPLDEFERDGAE